MRFAGKEFEDMQTLVRLAAADPASAIETFRVAGEYGNVPHGHLEVERTGGLGDVDGIGVMAYEELLLCAIRCVGTDYVEFARQAGVEVDSVRLELVGTLDLRGQGRLFGLAAPASAKTTWSDLVVRAQVRLARPATDAQAQAAHRAAWDNNLAAAALAIPVRHDVRVQAVAMQPRAR